MKRLSLLLFVALSAPALFAQKQISAREVVQAIDKNQSVQYDGVVITGDLDFTALSNRKIKKEKGWEEIKTTVEVPVVFRNCTFKGDVIAYKHLEENGSRTKIFNIEVNTSGLTYSADFRENAVFENCVFENGSEFKYSTFSKVANFSGSKFAEQANFKYAQFRQDAFYNNIRFDDYANFKYADFLRRADFQGGYFRDYADFKYAEFEEKVNFGGSRFQRNADFKYADFNAGASFDKTDFDGSVDFKYSNGKRYVSR